MQPAISTTRPAAQPVRRITVSTLSPESLGPQQAAIAAAAPASTAYQVSSGALYVPVYLVDSGTVTLMFAYNGAATSGNTDIGIYSESGVLLVSSGSTAGSGTGALQSFNVTDTYIPAGRYYLAIAVDNTTAEFFTTVASVPLLAAWGCASQTSAFPLPSTATMVTVATHTRVPVMGFTYRSFV